MAEPLQPQSQKSPAQPPALVLRRGASAEGGRAEARYVHKIGTSPKVLVFRGSSREGAELARMERRAKLTREVVGSLNRCGREDKAKALATCGQWFDVWVNHAGEAKILPCPCDSMFCPDCANRRAVPLIKKLRGMVNKKGCSYWFLTLTVPNVEDLSRYDIRAISEQFAGVLAWLNKKDFCDEEGNSLRVCGGARSIECVYNPKLKSWHPHIHVLLEMPSRVPMWWVEVLKIAWFEVTGGARYVNLKRAYSVTKRGKKKYNRLDVKALKEVCKYVTKCAEFAGNHLLVDEFLRAFKGVRRIQCFGSFLRVDAAEVDGGTEGEDGENSDAEVRLSDSGYRRVPFKAHISDTCMRADGTRQLSFDFMEKVRAWQETADPPWELTPEVPVTTEQHRIEFAGAMPEKSEQQTSLFDAAA